MKTEVVQVLIRRDLTSQVADAVFAHEIPILQVVRGPGNVEVAERNVTRFCLKPTDVVPRDELIRLKNKYKGFTKDGQNPVDVAFPDGSRDIELFYSEPEKFDMSAQGEGGGGMIGEEDVTEVDETANEPVAEKPAQTPTDRPVPEDAPLTRYQQLKNELTMLGVPFKGNASEADLETLRASVEDGVAPEEEAE